MVLGRLQRKGPDQTTEFLPAPDVERLAETLVAFANADGGFVIIGADAQGRLTEGLLIEDVEAALREAERQCRPAAPVQWYTAESGGGLPVTLQVAHSPYMHSLRDGRVLLRSGDANKTMAGEEIGKLASGKRRAEFELEPVVGATDADLDPNIIAEFIAKHRERHPNMPIETAETLLRDLGALTDKGELTVAGLLLFGRKPQFFRFKTGLTLVRFNTRAGVGGAVRPSDQHDQPQEITGPLATIIKNTWEILRLEMHPTTEVNGLTRTEVLDYPALAVREALVNAVAHRDYEVTGRQIEVRLFDDRLEIISPGGLAGHVTLDNIVDEHYSRNPRIVKGLQYWGFIEELGLGVDRIIQTMTDAGLPEPTFEATPHAFKVILRNTRVRAPRYEWEGEMTERQLKAIQYVEQHKSITNREYRELCPNVTAETLRLDLSDLVERGILLKMGDKRGTYYILKTR
jgi:ATP-dependent DNA helicase RecG